MTSDRLEKLSSILNAYVEQVKPPVDRVAFWEGPEKLYLKVLRLGSGYQTLTLSTTLQKFASQRGITDLDFDYNVEVQYISSDVSEAKGLFKRPEGFVNLCGAFSLKYHQATCDAEKNLNVTIS